MLVVLSIPPSGNHRVAITRNGAHRTPRYAAWLEETGWRARLAEFKPLEGPVRVDMIIYYKRSIDVDNVMKCVFDGLQGHAYLNDDQICEGTFSKEYVAKSPRVVVHVEAI